MATAIYQPLDRHAWLDAGYQTLNIVAGLVPVALVAYLLVRSAEPVAAIGLPPERRDVSDGVVLALVVGAAGLGFRFLANAAGANVQLAVGGTGRWWQIGIVLVQSLAAAIGEEMIVLAFLLHRLGQVGVSTHRAVAISSVVRGSYHLYQGFGGGVANVALGVIFGELYVRRRRVGPFIVAHFLIDAVATVGYLELHRHFHWLH